MEKFSGKKGKSIVKNAVNKDGKHEGKGERTEKKDPIKREEPTAFLRKLSAIMKKILSNCS